MRTKAGGVATLVSRCLVSWRLSAGTSLPQTCRPTRESSEVVLGPAARCRVKFCKIVCPTNG